VVKKWVKPARGTFSFINYSKDSCYEPDFIVETVEGMFLCEIKRRSDLETPEVLSKAEAALFIGAILQVSMLWKGAVSNGVIF